MKNAYILIIALYAILAGGCSRETEQVAGNGNNKIMTVSAVTADIADGPETRTHLSGTSVLWDATDAIGVIGNLQEKAEVFYNVAVDGVASNQFTGKKVTGTEFYAYYPSSLISVPALGTGVIRYEGNDQVMFRRSLFAAAGPNAVVKMPMVARYDGEKFHFKQLCGILHFRLKGTKTIEEIALTGIGGEILDGTAYVNLKDSNLKFEIVEEDDNFETGYGARFIGTDSQNNPITPYTLKNEDVWDVYFPVPPTYFSQGIKLIIQYQKDGGSESVVKNIIKPLDVPCAVMLSFPVLDVDELIAGTNVPMSVEFEFPAISFNCSKSTESFVSNEQMTTNIFQPLNLTGEEFFNRFPVFDNNANTAGQIGNVILALDFNYSVFQIRWTLTPDEIWSIATKTYTPVELERTVYFRNSEGTEVYTLTLKTTIQPFNTVFNLDWPDDYIPEYWIAHNHDASMAQWDATTITVATPWAGLTDASYCTFVSDLNARFCTHDGYKPGYTAGTLKVVRDGVYVGNVEYFFDQSKNCVNGMTFSKPGDEINQLEHVNLRVSSDGLTLYACQGALTAAQKATRNYEQLIMSGIPASYICPVATITNNPFGSLGQQNIITYQENDLAKALLNTDAFYAFIGARGQICGSLATPHNVSILFHGQTSFKADFIRPVSLEARTPAHFVDAVDFGNNGTFIRYEDLVQPYDWRCSMFGQDTHFNPNNLNYWQYYGVGNPPSNNFVIHADVSRATCTLGGASSQIPSSIVLMANECNNDPAYALDNWMMLTPGVDADWYTDISADPFTIYSFRRTQSVPMSYTIPNNQADHLSNYGYLTYSNNGSPVGDFNIMIPVVVFYKWGKLTTSITIGVYSLL